MKNYLQEHELMRRKVWSSAWAATAASSNCVSEITCTKYADAALAAFDVRFPQMKDTATNE